jgi:hypothetical protein
MLQIALDAVAPFCRTASMNRLNGWQRLGVVLSIAWIAIVCVEYLIEEVPVDQAPSSFRLLLAVIALPAAIWPIGFAFAWVQDGFRRRDPPEF